MTLASLKYDNNLLKPGRFKKFYFPVVLPVKKRSRVNKRTIPKRHINRNHSSNIANSVNILIRSHIQHNISSTKQGCFKVYRIKMGVSL